MLYNGKRTKEEMFTAALTSARERHAKHPDVLRLNALHEDWTRAEYRLSATPQVPQPAYQEAIRQARIAFDAYFRAKHGTSNIYSLLG